MINDTLTQARNEIKHVVSGCNAYHETAIDEVFHNLQEPFEGLETEALQRAYVRKNFGYVPFQEIELGKTIIRKKKGNKRKLYEKAECFMYIPIVESLKQFLANKRLRSMIIRPHREATENIFFDICDGSIFQNDQYFKEHPEAIGLILYHDEVEVCNPLDSKAGKHKLDMYYYVIINIDPKYRSKRSAVRLVAITNAKYVKKYGIDSIMLPIINDLKKIHDGVTFHYDRCSVNVFGKVVICVGDTLGQHLWGGFKEGVGASFQKCRSCYCQFDQMQKDFTESSFTERTKHSYNLECTQIENSVGGIRKELKLIYGLNQRSPLCELPDFDVTSQLPQDIMHTISEGVLQYEVRLVIEHFINNSSFTLDQLNGCIANHNYGYTEFSDKPGPLRDTVFSNSENYKLKYSAAQARLFLRLLPFFLSKLVDITDEYYCFMIQLLEITQIMFSPFLHLNTIQHSKQLIQEHLIEFKRLFPEKNILPKQHYLIHLPKMITMYGPLVRSSCFSFESTHSYFKTLAQKQNFKNISKSLANRCQYRDCLYLNEHPIFTTEMKYGKLKTLSPEQMVVLRNEMRGYGLLPAIDFQIVYNASWVILNGTKYCKEGILIVSVTPEKQLPIFGTIKEIYVIGGFVYFDLLLYRTSHFEYSYQAYFVEQFNQTKRIISAYECLVDYNVFHKIYNENGNLYVSVKYDINDLLEEHYKGFNPIF